MQGVAWLKMAMQAASGSGARHTTKLLRAVSGIGGVSDRSLSTILAWVRENPDVLDSDTCHATASLPTLKTSPLAVSTAALCCIYIYIYIRIIYIYIYIIIDRRLGKNRMSDMLYIWNFYGWLLFPPPSEPRRE